MSNQNETAEDSKPLPQLLLELPMYLMLALSRAGYRHAMQSNLRLRLPEFSVLATAAEFGPCSQQEIGQRIGFDKSDVTKMINRLEEDGLVERRVSAEDQRRQNIFITAKGKKQLEISQKEIDATMKSFLGGLNESEYEKLRKLLLKALAFQDPRFKE